VCRNNWPPGGVDGTKGGRGGTGAKTPPVAMEHEQLADGPRTSTLTFTLRPKTLFINWYFDLWLHA